MPTKQNDVDLEPLLDAQQDHLNISMAESAAIDAKALGIAAANVAILVFIAQASIDFSSGWAQFALLAPFALSLLGNILAILPRNYIGPGVDTVRSPEYLAMDRETLVEQLLSNAEAAIANNVKLNKLRWRYCAYSLLLTAIGTGILFVII